MVAENIRSKIEFCQQLQKSDSVVTWDVTVDRHAQTVRNLITILNQPEFENSPDKQNLTERLDTLLKRCMDSDFQIAFVGAINAGKSTLINAILGQDVASTRVTPETAVLTKFRNSENYYVKVRFYTQEEWKKLWKDISNKGDVFKEEFAERDGAKHQGEWVGHADYQRILSIDKMKAELERWSSSKHPEHYFVKEIEVGLPTLNLPENVIFVDTPGLDDPVKYRSDVTTNYIMQANAVFVCVTAHAMTGEEIRTISKTFSRSSSPDKVFIIGTQVDNLNFPMKDWEAQKQEWVKYMKEASCYGSEQSAREHILPAAAFMQNLCREYCKNPENVTDDEKKILLALAMKYETLSLSDMMNGQSVIAEGIQKLQEYTYIDALLHIIREKILTKYKTYLLDDILKAYMLIKSDLRNYFLKIAESSQQNLDASNSDIKKINDMLEKARTDAEINQQNQERLNDVIAIAQEFNQQRIQELEKSLKTLSGKE